MIQNKSPWINELKRQRKYDKLAKDIDTDILIIGGGIAGVSTAFFLLKYTNYNVSLVEGYKIAHGATGHNAGQIVSYFEKPFKEIVEKYGLHLAVQAQNDILSGWNLLEEIYEDALLETTKYIFDGYAGYSSTQDILIHLENRFLKKYTEYNLNTVLVAEELLLKIPQKYEGLYSFVPHIEILELLETDNKNYICAFPSKKGCINSALFTEELFGFLLDKYYLRFNLYENSKINEINLNETKCISKTGHHMITSSKIVLCTNGFETIKIINNGLEDIDKDFHENLEGLIGYMSGYIQDLDKDPIAISYYEKANEPYYYLTRRPYSIDKHVVHDLICLGGPDHALEDKSVYKFENEYPKEAQSKLDTFLHKNYIDSPKHEINYRYNWYGLMGYTKNNLRLIGPDPKNQSLFYNLGCNGVGILPSIFGGKKISMFINKDVKEKSIFDPV